MRSKGMREFTVGSGGVLRPGGSCFATRRLLEMINPPELRLSISSARSAPTALHRAPAAGAPPTSAGLHLEQGHAEQSPPRHAAAPDSSAVTTRYPSD